MAGRPKGIECGRLLKKAIAKAGGQSALAVRMGMTRQAISSWVTGKSRPSKGSHSRLLEVAQGTRNRRDRRRRRQGGLPGWIAGSVLSGEKRHIPGRRTRD